MRHTKINQKLATLTKTRYAHEKDKNDYLEKNI